MSSRYIIILIWILGFFNVYYYRCVFVVENYIVNKNKLIKIMYFKMGWILGL